MFQNILNLDIETYSGYDLKKVGTYKYTHHPDFQILILCYSLNGAPVERLDLTKDKIPQRLIDLILDRTCLKKAFNAQFERVCLSVHLNTHIGSSSWECTMVRAGMLGLPMNLEGVGIALNLNTLKAAIGKKLIRIFCIPCKPTKANGMRMRNLPEHFPEEWEQFIDYCQIDVEVEMEVGIRIVDFEIPTKEKQLYNLDQRINDFGILVDPVLIQSALNINEEFTGKLEDEAIRITGLENPNSAKQLKDWLNLEIDETVTTLKKDAVHKLLKGRPPGSVRRVLEIRQMISKSSIKKYDAMLSYMGSDERVRGLLQFYGANRTGRWAGRGIQPQNLAQNHLGIIEYIRQLVREGDVDTLELYYEDIADVLSQLIRTAFIASPGRILLMTDFSAIEARVIAWLAGEKWRLDVFRTRGKIYEASGSAMFKVPIEAVTKGSLLRQKAKISELALGYQGSVGALRTMGAEKMGLTEEELPELVGRWRAANPHIVKFWYAVQDMAINTVRTGVTGFMPIPNNPKYGLKFYMKKGTFFIQLPSGRSLAYLKPVLKTNANGYDSLYYHGVNQKTKQWQEIPTYGGKLVENIVQAIARDLLAEKMLIADALGFEIVFHVHDEIVFEIDADLAQQKANLDEVNRIMREPLSWSGGLPLAADSYCSPFYKKD